MFVDAGGNRSVQKKQQDLVKLQREILPSAIKMLKPGGYMVYSTCTFSTLEDEGSLKFILDNFPEMSVGSISEFGFQIIPNPLNSFSRNMYNR